MRLAVQEEAFDPGAETTAFTAAVTAEAGAIVTFTGLVRDLTGDLAAMEIEHYPGMTERAIAAMMDQAKARFGLVDALVIHRYGRLTPAEPIMMVATAAPHRGAAFQAAEFLMDWLKSRAPFWKKEARTTGESWVAARDEDEEQLARWQGSERG